MDPCRECPPMQCSLDRRQVRFSLTRELNKGGCAYYYMNQAFPQLARFVRRLSLPKEPLLVEAPVRGMEGLSGTSFDRRLRYEYEPDYSDNVVVRGLNFLATELDGESVVSLRRGLESANLDARALYAGVCDTVSRNRSQGIEAWYTLQSGGDSLRQQLVDDISNLMKIARERLTLKDPVFGPTFGLSSRWIGGGDADLIDDGCLLEVKTVKVVYATQFIRQALAYALLDVDDDWKLDSVGVYLARHGILWRVPLSAAAEEAGLTIAELRQRAPWGNPDERKAMAMDEETRIQL